MALVFKRSSPGLRVIQVSHLNVGQVVNATLYHETATPLLKPGEFVREAHLRAMKVAGIEEVYECKTEDDVITLVNATTKFANPLDSVPVGSPIPFNIYDGDNRFLLRKDGVLAEGQYKRLEELNVDKIYVNDEKLLQILRAYDLELMKYQVETIEQEFQQDEELRVVAGEPGLPSLHESRPQPPRTPEYIEDAQKRYAQHVHATADLLSVLKKGLMLNLSVVDDILGALLEDLIRDLDLTLGLANAMDDGSFEYHSVNVAALSVGVGLSLGYQESDLKELGFAALLHETGMLGVPREILWKKTNLTPQERQRISEHPVIALNYLGLVTGLPHAAMIAVYQEHECMDRSGYPNKRPGNLIHDFSQIIGICDIFEAMTSPRPYREPMTPYRVLERLIFETSKLRYNQAIMRALLQLISLFPIGSWIRLSNNCVGRVVGSNYQRYDRPIVSILYDDKGQPLSQIKPLDLLQQEEVQIADILDGSQFKVPPTLGF